MDTLTIEIRLETGTPPKWEDINIETLATSTFVVGKISDADKALLVARIIGDAHKHVASQQESQIKAESASALIDLIRDARKEYRAEIGDTRDSRDAATDPAFAAELATKYPEDVIRVDEEEKVPG